MIGFDIAAALPDLRQQGESIMTATCRVERKTGTEFDPDANTDVDTYNTIYEGPCRVRADNTAAALVMAGDQQVTTQPYRCLVPLTAPEIRAHDRLTVTASDDPQQVGKALSITTVASSSQPIVRRFRAIDDQG